VRPGASLVGGSTAGGSNPVRAVSSSVTWPVAEAAQAAASYAATRAQRAQKELRQPRFGTMAPSTSPNRSVDGDYALDPVVAKATSD